jgi:uncharacterized membrane protein YfcA
VLTLALALLIGVALGMLGGGGSILTVPVLTYVSGLDAKTAIAASLPIVALSSAFGALGHWRAGNVHARIAVTFGAFAMVGGFAGARAAQWISGQTQMLLFATVMLLAAVSMLRTKKGVTSSEPVVARVSIAELAPIGLGVGVLTGLVGVGGGFLIVPALVKLARIPMRVAIGTSLTVIAMNATAGTVGYIGQVSWPFALLIPFIGLALVGVAIGTTSAQRVPQSVLRQSFGVLLLVVGSFVMYQNRSVFTRDATAAVPRDVSSDHQTEV